MEELRNKLLDWAKQFETPDFIKDDPKMCQRLIQAEKSVGHSFFPPLYIPQRFCKNKQYPYVEEVLEYVKEHTPDMFEPEGGYACMSLFHGLCE